MTYTFTVSSLRSSIVSVTSSFTESSRILFKYSIVPKLFPSLARCITFTCLLPIITFRLQLGMLISFFVD